MKWLSKSVEELIAGETPQDPAQTKAQPAAKKEPKPKPKVHDAVVVGSGYGGAVSALRLAEQGIEVLVLERGEEWTTAEFPNDIGNAFGELRLDRHTASNVSGNESGLYDLHLGRGIGALVGNGLGGTSLINANVAMQPDGRVFEKRVGQGGVQTGPKVWPIGLQRVNRALPPDLATAYLRARDELRIEQFSKASVCGPADPNGDQKVLNIEPPKYQRLRELAGSIAQNAASDVAVTFEPAWLTVALGETTNAQAWARPPFLSSCVGCGDCVSGCNQNAKRSLDTTYLARAFEAGARLFTGATVLSVHRAEEPEPSHWVIRFVRTAARMKQRDGVVVPVHELHVRHVVLSAGTFGSTEILQRSKACGLPLSAALGQRLSTNGDALAFGYLLDQPVHGIGGGSKHLPGEALGVGPTITGVIRIDHKDEVCKSVLIQEGAVPGAIAGAFHEMITTSATVTQLAECQFREVSSDGATRANRRDWAVLQERGLTHTQTLLAMGHDQSQGTLEYDGKHDRIVAVYQHDKRDPTYLEQEKYLGLISKQGGLYIQNPVLSPMPEKLRVVADMTLPGNATFTVHPLGGCCMADTIETGVVNQYGQVFEPRAGVPGDAHYDGLYVLDGSIVPTSLGANPLLTITALAERAMAKLAPEIAQKLKSAPTAPQTLPHHPPAGAPSVAPMWPHSPEVKVHFTEAMRGEVTWGNDLLKAHLLLHLPVEDLALFWADGQHQIVIPNQHYREHGDREQLEARLRLDQEDAEGKVLSTRKLMVRSGLVSILPIKDASLATRLSRWIRTVWTFYHERGRDELLRAITDLFARNSAVRQARRPIGVPGAPSGWFAKLVAYLKVSKHASECRVMRYRLSLVDESSNGEQPFCSYELLGSKAVGYPASWRALWRKTLGMDAILDRPNVWAALGTMTVRINDASGHAVAQGQLALDLLDMTRMHAPQVGPQRDTLNALLSLAGYPLWFGRLMLKTRLFDFRLPDYPTRLPKEFDPNMGPVPGTDQADPPTLWPEMPPLRVFRDEQATQITLIAAQKSQSFWVPSTSAPTGKVELKLTRYPQPKLEFARDPTSGAVRVKALLMLNGFAQSTLGFVPQEHVRRSSAHCDAHRDVYGEPAVLDEPGLAEFFYEQGYDIWMFDYRTSSILDASKYACTLDDIAQFDIPAAVKEMERVLHSELKLDEQDLVQIYVFAHCVGAASVAISLLGGHLQHQGDPKLGKLAGVTLSQMQMFLVGSKTAQFRLKVGGFLRDTLGIEYMRLSAAERQPTPFETVLDALFASLPVDDNERCPHEDARYIARPGICTCKRMSGTISRLLKHDRIKEETHDRLPIYFGRANTSLLVHGARCVENERLVNADGQNVYVTDDNIRAYLRLPIAILHGAQNALFHVESARRTIDQLCRVNHDLASAINYQARAYDLIVAEDYAHFDCTIGHGRLMQEQILAPLRNFYDKAWRLGSNLSPPQATPQTEPRSEPKAPLAGPVMGWSRVEQRGGQQFRVQRVWIEVDETESDLAKYAVTVIRCGEQFVSAQLWPILRVPLDPQQGVDPKDLGNAALPARAARVVVALADLEFEMSATPLNHQVAMFSVHEFDYTRMWPTKQPAPAGAAAGPPSKAPSTPSTPTAPIALAPPSLIARPITPEELEASMHPHRVPGAGAVPWGRKLGPAMGLAAGAALPYNALGAGVMARLFDAAATGGQQQLTPGLAYVERIAPSGPLDAQYAETLIATLAKADRLTAEEALRGDPATPSRKSRRLARNSAWADVRAPLCSPDNWKGLRFLAACCRHPGLAFEDNRADASFDRIDELLRSDLEGHRDFMFMLGDQIYADASAGLIDSPSAIEKIALRNRHAFSTRGFHTVTSQLPSYMVIDDHEIGDNWSRDELFSANLETLCAANRLYAAGRASFAAYQWSHSPRSINAPGFNYCFTERDIAFFVLDTRTERRRFDGAPRICDPLQLAELELWLQAFGKQDARPKFIVSGSVLAPGLQRWALPPGLSHPMAESWQLALHQRQEVLNLLLKHEVKNVVFLSGDYHCDATAVLDFTSGLKAYAIVTPPLYAPFPGINVNPSEVLTGECIALEGGGQVTITARAREGSGFADIHVSQLPTGQWRLGVHCHRLMLEDKSPRYSLETREFLLS